MREKGYISLFFSIERLRKIISERLLNDTDRNIIYSLICSQYNFCRLQRMTTNTCKVGDSCPGKKPVEIATYDTNMRLLTSPHFYKEKWVFTVYIYTLFVVYIIALFHRYKRELYAEYNVTCENDQEIYIVVTLLNIRGERRSDIMDQWEPL